MRATNALSIFESIGLNVGHQSKYVTGLILYAKTSSKPRQQGSTTWRG